MSSCISYFQDGKIFVCADSRVSTKIDGKSFVVTDRYKKIRQCGDKAIFMSGNTSLVELVFNSVKSNVSIADIQKIYSYVCDNKNNDELELIIDVFTLENNIPVIYHGSHEVIEFVRVIPTQKDIYTTGARGIEILNHIKQAADQYEKDNKAVDIDKLILETYEAFACEYIGGDMHYFMITQEGVQSGKVKIQEDKAYPIWIGEPFPYHCDAQGNLIASNANLSGNLNMTTGSINWGNVNTDPVATTASNVAGMAYNAAQQIAAGTYTGGTFINGKMIYSPTIMTGTSGRYLRLQGSTLESVDSGIKKGMTFDGSDGSIKWFSDNVQVGTINTFKSDYYDTLVVEHSAITLNGKNVIDLRANDTYIGQGGNTTFYGNVNFSNSNVTGVTAKFG